MAWDWIEKGAKRLQELGSDYKQHHALIERLLALDSDAARDELAGAWPAMDERARAGVKLTLAGLVLSQQAVPSSAASKTRLERLKALHAQADQVRPDAQAAGKPVSTEARFAAGAARVTTTLADVAERARPKAGQLIDSARKGIERHGPAVEAAVKSVVSELLKPNTPASGGGSNSEPSSATRDPGVPPPIPEDREPRPAAAPSTATISGTWSGTLRAAGGDETWLRSASRTERPARVGLSRHERVPP